MQQHLMLAELVDQSQSASSVGAVQHDMLFNERCSESERQAAAVRYGMQRAELMCANMSVLVSAHSLPVSSPGSLPS